MNKNFNAAVEEGLSFEDAAKRSGLKLDGVYTFEAFDADGNLKWRKELPNLVTNEGEDYMLDVGLNAATQITTWYLGLVDSSPTTDEGDTMGSHAGWAEITDYDEAVRQTVNFGTVSGQSVDNSGNVAAFSINASVTVGGAFLVSDDTKGGTTGTLYSVGAFSGGDKTGLENGDTLNVTYTATAGGA